MLFRSGETGKSAQPKLPPPTPRSPPRAPLPTLPFRTEQVDPKKRREQKGKDIMETGKPRPSSEKKGISITPNKKYRYICLVVMSLKKRKKEKNN